MSVATAEAAQMSKSKPRSRNRLVLRVAIWAALALATVVVVFLILLFHTPALPVAHTDPAAAARLNAKLKQVQENATPASPLQLSVEQTELNSYLNSYLGKDSDSSGDAPSSVRDMKVTVINDVVHLYLLLDVHGKGLALQMEGKLRTENGFLHFDPLSGKVGALPIPKSVLQSSMRKMMDSPESRAALRLPRNVSDVRVEDGRIVATFK